MTNENLPDYNRLPDYNQKHEYRLPVIVCPICGDKDHLKLTSYEAEVNNNLQEYWYHPYGPPRYYSASMTHNHNINGFCTKCGSSFNFSISATIPRDKPILK
jgi:sarcosine oxidase delta subunit